jgi:gingipain R
VKFVTMCLLAVTAVMAGTVTHTLELSPQDVVMNQSDNYSVVQLALDGSGMTQAWTTEPGEPLLPVVSGNVLIPAGAEIEDITVTELERVEIGTGILIHPVQPMRPLSEFNSVPFVEPDRAVYGTDVAYPSRDLVRIPAGNKTGYRIAGFLYCPFEYYPASGRLVLVTRARVTVTYRESAVQVPVLTPEQRDWAATDVAGLVVNPEDVSRMAPPAVEKDAGELDVVIFTSSTLAPNLVDFRKWLMRKGYYTEIVRHDTLSTSGRDVQEKMRNFLRDKFENNGLKYVIMAGDTQHCPLRYGYLLNEPYNVPAEMYFGDLDGSWDANNNNRFGEMEGDSVDLFQDIYVGRLPLDDAADAANFLRKDTTYEIHPDTGYLDNVLLPAEVLWGDIDFHGMIVNTNILRMLNKRSAWEVDSGINMGASRMISAINSGTQLLHYAGHGSNTAFGSTFNTSNISSLTNSEKPFISSSMACNCGWFDYSSDCLAEEMVNATNGGAVSAMYNARYGWGAPPTQGPNSNMNCQFFHNFLQGGITQGQAHGLARDFLRNESFSQMTTRWAMYTNTLQGDPTMMMWRELPLDLAVDFPDTIMAMPQTLTADVSYVGVGQAGGARVALTHLGELVTRGVTNSSGVATLAIPAIEDTLTLQLTVTAQDGRLFTKTVAVGAGCGNALVVYSHNWVDDMNGRLDPRDEADLYLVVENRGNGDAEGVSGQLHSDSPYLTVVRDTSSYGDVAVGDTAQGTAYRVRVGRDCPQGHRAELYLIVSGSDGLWRSELELTVGLPHARGGLWATLDTGDYVCGIFGNGGIGTSQWRGEGYGLIYPKSRQWSTATMMHGSFMMGIDTTWVVDNYYGAPDWKVCPEDFQMEESVRIVYPPELGDQEYRTVFSDANHPDPMGVTVTHRAFGSADPDHEDFIILEYRIHNNDTAAVENFYTGVACDFRTPYWRANDEYDYAGTDSVRQIAYVMSALSSETLAVGVSHIYPDGMNAFANCLFHTTYINDGFTKAEKMLVMDGTIRQTSGPTRGNYHCVASSGPYAIPAGDSQVVAYVICGGRNVGEMQVHYDTAFGWYVPPVGLAQGQRPSLVRGLQISPRLFSDAVKVHYSLSRVEPVEVYAFDATGRVADRYAYTPAAMAGEFTWRPKVAPGVYFVQVGDASEKVLKLR